LNRILDIFLAFFFLLFLAPFILLISFLIKISSRGSIIYWSKRIGKKGKIFLVKTKQMNQKRIKNKPSTETKQLSKKEKKTKRKNKKSWKQSNEK
jgi:lipopolysaccharide/colanic/teichoic acid biosynthesis glycosyltransferase